MNKILLENSLIEFKKMLSEIEMDEKDKQYRLNKIEFAHNGILKSYQDYFSIAHEIRAIQFFKALGNVKVSRDCANEPGSDLRYMKKYSIECVICTEGDGEKDGKKGNKNHLIESGYQDCENILDLNKKFRQIALRITSVIKSKKDKYYEYIGKNIIDQSDKFCIFLNLGALAQEFPWGEYCHEFTRIFVGRGPLQININKENIGQFKFDFGEKRQIINNNSETVSTDIFTKEEYAGVSAIIVTCAGLGESYENSTVVFANPNAVNAINTADFKNIPVWLSNEANEYCVYLDGEMQKWSQF